MGRFGLAPLLRAYKPDDQRLGGGNQKSFAVARATRTCRHLERISSRLLKLGLGEKRIFV
jgi:uncharacterized protein YjiS (DUF1127 family)